MVRLASCLSVFAGLAFAAQAQRDASDREAQQKFFQFMSEVLADAEKMRATPITEPRIPRQKVNGNWDIVFYKTTTDSFVVTYTLDPEYKFHVQAILCELDNTTKIMDATFLGAEEKASTFYDANLSFVVDEPAAFARCQPKGVVADIKPGQRPLHRSHDRVLVQMCNFLRFLQHQRDTAREIDFLALILAKQRQVMIDADAKGDLSRVQNSIDLFDRFFPYEIFDGKPALTPADLTTCREFFETTLLYRRKLKTLAPGTAARIPKDEALLRILQ